MNAMCRGAPFAGLCAFVCLSLTVGCAERAARAVNELRVRDAIERYAADRADVLTAQHTRTDAAALAPALGRLAIIGEQAQGGFDSPYLTFGLYASEDQAKAASQPATGAAKAVPSPYWKEDIFKQMGSEAMHFGTRDFWTGYRKSFWKLENALVLTAAMGASIAIRETGVDDTIAGRIHHHRQLGDFDEPLQILGNPATHFAATGVLWLGTAITKDIKEHEVAKTLVQALCVNGVTVELLKFSTNTSSPDGDRWGWPSGHTSSAFTVAAVLNEYYGPWVGVPSLALAGLVGYQRLDSRVHDFSDVAFGAVLGYVIGSSIAHENKGDLPELLGMKVLPYADPSTGAAGIALMKRF